MLYLECEFVISVCLHFNYSIIREMTQIDDLNPYYKGANKNLLFVLKNGDGDRELALAFAFTTNVLQSEGREMTPN